MRTPGKLIAVLAAAGLTLAACSSSPNGTGGKKRGYTSNVTASGGTANVAYAGSLVGLVQSTLQPAFQKATGDKFVGKGAGSTALAKSILDGELSPGAFVSVGVKAIESLWPGRARFVLTLGTDPLVVAYSSKSRYASQLDAIASGKQPLSKLFTLFATPGFRLGRTDPNLDPQGAFFILMCKLAEKELHLAPGTADKVLGITATAPTGSSTQLFDETAIDPQIAAGTVDAGSAYLAQALQYHLKYIELPANLNFSVPADKVNYSTVSIKLADGTVVPGGLISLNETLVLPGKSEHRSKADEAADEAWLAYLVSAKGRALLQHAGYTVGAPKLTLATGYHSASSVLPASVLHNFEQAGGTIASS